MDISFRQFAGAVRWLMVTGGVIFLRRPRQFMAATATMGMVRIARMLALMLPFKVIMLAASSDVPSYAPFIALQDKPYWIGGLAAGAIVAYVLVHVLTALATRMSDAAGHEITQEATHLHAVANQREHSQTIFHAFTTLSSALIFWAVCLSVIALLDPRLAIAHLGLLALSVAVGTVLAIVPPGSFLGRAHDYLIERTDAYLSFNGMALFFSLFLVILYPFLAGATVNMLVALISFIVTRQSISALSSLTAAAVRLVRKRHLVDALMIKGRQLVTRPSLDRQTFAAAFDPENRLRIANDLLAAGELSGEVVAEVVWKDPVVGLPFFSVGTASGRRFHLQVYARARHHLCENEDVLFGHLARQQVHAPALVARMVYGQYVCRLVELGAVRAMGSDAWKEKGTASLIAIAGVQPPESLVAAFTATHPLLHQTLTTEFLAQAEVAVTAGERERTFAFVNENLPRLRYLLKQLPLTLANPDAAAHAALATDAPELVFLYWGRWALAPLGAGVLANLGDADMETALTGLRRRRSDIGRSIGVDNLRLAALSQRLHRQITGGNYGAALVVMARIQELLVALEPKKQLQRQKELA